MKAHDDALRTGSPFWLTKSGLLATYPPLDRAERCDVVVIGAGVTGAIAALRLADAGCDVVVVDAHDAGAGSTAASTGLLMYETDTELAELEALVGVDRAVAAGTPGRAGARRHRDAVPARAAPARLRLRAPTRTLPGHVGPRGRRGCAPNARSGSGAASPSNGSRPLSWQRRMGLVSHGGIWSDSARARSTRIASPTACSAWRSPPAPGSTTAPR